MNMAFSEEEWNKNILETVSMMVQKRQELGLSYEQIKAATVWIKEVSRDAALGIIRPETMDVALKVINHDL